MAISYIGATTAPAGTGAVAGSVATATTIVLAKHASTAVGDLLVAILGCKPDTTTVTTPTGWTLANSTAGGGGTTGLDTGPTRTVTMTRVADGTATDTPTVTLSGQNVVWAQVLTFRNATGVWSVAGTGGSDSTTGVAWSVTCDSLAGLTAGDWAVVGSTIPTDVTTPTQFTAEAITATGISAWGTAVEVSEPDSSAGNDIGGFVFYQPVTTGTATAAPVITATASGTTTNVRGTSSLVRLREVAAEAPSVPGGVQVYTQSWTGTDGTDWPAGWTFMSGDTSGTTSRTIQSNQGQQQATAGGFRNDMLTGLADVANFDVTVTFDPGLTDGATGNQPAFFFRAVAANTTLTGCYLEITLLDPNFGRLRYMRAPAYSGLGDHLFTHAGPGTVYKLRVRGDGQTVQAKIWPASGAEPGAWGLTVSETVHTTGRFGFTLFAPDKTRQVRWDDLTIHDLNATPTTVTAAAALTAGPVMTVGAIQTQPAAAALTVAPMMTAGASVTAVPATGGGVTNLLTADTATAVSRTLAASVTRATLAFETNALAAHGTTVAKLTCTTSGAFIGTSFARVAVSPGTASIEGAFRWSGAGTPKPCEVQATIRDSSLVILETSAVDLATARKTPTTGGWTRHYSDITIPAGGAFLDLAVSVTGNPVVGDEVLLDKLGVYQSSIPSSWVYRSSDSYSNAVLADLPVGYWRLGDASGSTVAVDETGTQDGAYYANGTTVGRGPTVLSPGAISGNDAALFDGNDHVRVPHVAAQHPTGAFTVEAWVKPTDYTTVRTILSRAKFNSGFRTRLNTNGTTYCLVSDAASTNFFQSSGSTAVPLDGAWHHIAIAYDPAVGEVRHYVDGQPAGTTTHTAGWTTDSHTDVTAIGVLHETNLSEPYAGGMDEVALYPTALSAARVLAHFDARAASATTTVTASAALTAGPVMTVGAIQTQPAAAALTAGVVMTAGSTVTSLPGQVTGVTATPAAESLNVSWTAVVGADSYIVEWELAGSTVTAAAGLTAPAVMGVGATRDQPAAVALTAPAALTATSIRTVPAAAALTAGPVMAAGASRTATAGAALTIPATLAAGAARTVVLGASLVAPVALTAVGERTALVAAALTAGPVMAVTATGTVPAAAALTAPAVLTAAAPGLEGAVGAVLTAPAWLTADGTRERPGAAALTAPVVLEVAGTRETHAQAALTARALLTVAGTRGMDAAASLTAPARLDVAGARDAHAAAALLAPAALTGTGTRAQPAAVAWQVPVVMSADGSTVPMVVAGAALNARPVLTAGGLRETHATVALTARAVLAAGAVREQQAAAALTVPARLLSNSTAGGASGAELTAPVVLTAQAVRAQHAAVSLAAAAVLSVDASGGALAGAGLLLLARLTAGVLRERAAAAALAVNPRLTAAAQVLGPTQIVVRPGTSTLLPAPAGTATVQAVPVGTAVLEQAARAVATLVAAPSGTATVQPGQVGQAVVQPSPAGTATVQPGQVGTALVGV